MEFNFQIITTVLNDHHGGHILLRNALPNKNYHLIVLESNAHFDYLSDDTRVLYSNSCGTVCISEKPFHLAVIYTHLTNFGDKRLFICLCILFSVRSDKIVTNKVT